MNSATSEKRKSLNKFRQKKKKKENEKKVREQRNDDIGETLLEYSR